MAARSAMGLTCIAVAFAAVVLANGSLAADLPPGNGNGKAQPKSEANQGKLPQPELKPEAASPNGTPSAQGLPPANNDLGLLAVPDPSMGSEGLKSGCDFCGEGFCGPPGRFWIRADYLAWWTSGVHVPALVTTNASVVPIGQAGVLPPAGTAQILFGDSTLNTQGRSGWRLTLGAWIDPCQRWGVQGDYFDLGGVSDGFEARSTATGDPILARPFFDVNPETGLPRQAAQLLSYPNEVTGSVQVVSRDYFQSAGVAVRHLLCAGTLCSGGCGGGCGAARCGPACCRLDLLLGYRYYGLRDELTVHENLTGLPTATNPAIRGVTFDVRDTFRAQNDFHGGEIGLVAQTYRGPWSAELMLKMAFGNNHEFVMVDSHTTISRTGQQLDFPGGLLGQLTNLGPHTRDEFVVIPQLGLELGYQVTCHLRALIGYNFIYWAPVTRAAHQIDTYIDSARIPGGGRADGPVLPFPAFEWHCSNFWAHGINGGIEFRY